jgi:orotate phosphoribosyltransferase
MQPYQRDFIAYARQRGVLQFGHFMLRSGRESPYFFNSGRFNSGQSLAYLGRCYAQAIHASGLQFDMLYGAAYKGIPLVASTAIAWAQLYAQDVSYCFNRKQAKGHGEKGRIVGAPLAGEVLIVDDVISAGGSVRTSVDIIADAGARAIGVVIALDRQEQGLGGMSALEEIEQELGLKVESIVTLDHVIEFIREEEPVASDLVRRMRAYQAQYGRSC